MKTPQERALKASSSSWKEYTSATGRKYYYNASTKKTQWDMPEEMKAAGGGSAEGADASAAPAAAAPTPAPVAAAPTSGPTPPVGSAAAPPLAAAPDRPANGASSAADAPPAAKAEPTPDPQAEAERVISSFMSMLSRVGVPDLMEWDDALKLIVNTQEYKAVPNISKRKEAFLKWQEERRAEREEAERQRVRQLKVEFLQMLKETEELTSRTRFPKAVEMLGSEPRWLAVNDDLEREELFEEYTLSLERKEAAERRAQRKERMAAFKELLTRSGITVRSQWRKVQVQLEDEPECKALDKIDRLAVYEELVRELEAKEEQERQREREAERRQERKQRDAFRALLTTKYAEGAFHVRSRWRDVLELISGTDEYKAAASQGGSTPSEMFDDYLEQLNESWQAHRKTLKALMAALHGTFAVTADTNFDQFECAVKAADNETLVGVPQSSLVAFFEELQEKLAKEKAEEERRIKKQRRAAFDGWQDALRGLMGALLSSGTTWEEASAVMRGKPAAEDMGGAEQKEAFDELIESIKAAEAAEADGDGDDDHRHKRKKDKHRDRDRSRDRDRRDRDYRRDDDDDDERRRRKKEKKAKRHRDDRDGDGGDDEKRHKRDDDSD